MKSTLSNLWFKLKINYLTVIFFAAFFLLIALHYSYGIAWKLSWLKDPLEIEIFGSLVLVILINFLNLNSESNRRREEVTTYFNKVVKANALRALGTITPININAAENPKAYFDNSCINNLYSTIERHYHDIYEFLSFYESANKNTAFAHKLIELYILFENAYQLGVTLDDLLITLVRNKLDPDGLDDTRVKKEVIFYKATQFVDFPKIPVLTKLGLSKDTKDLSFYYSGEINGGFEADTYKEFKRVEDALKTKIVEIKELINSLNTL